ncbi:hypothetical protein VIM7927_03010 [Vibrio mangrovi]|uniref:Uncharacterized protein n=1 Tax=Vibrio mangrovi TaxID=474394 RepID=A0A1Y6IVQ4_9VIBR|nr:hypothetical protein VIM7927_03010 [Vibrio mangrovi]
MFMARKSPGLFTGLVPKMTGESVYLSLVLYATFS